MGVLHGQFCSRKCRSEFDLIIPLHVCEHCSKKFYPPNSRKRRFCSAECQRAHLVGSNHPRWMGDRKRSRGDTWCAARKAARSRDKACAGCGALPEAHQLLSVDHIVPFRLARLYAESAGIDPNDLRNLVCLCRSCHGMKTQIERRLHKGDIVGFITGVRPVIPVHVLIEAMKLWGLLPKSQLERLAVAEDI